MKKIAYIILNVMMFVALLAGCQKQKYEYPYTLRFNSHKVVVTKDSLTTPVIVYSNSDWTACLVDNPSWASLDRAGGSGIGEVKFTCLKNPGMARKARIAFASGAERDTVDIIQSAAIAEPAFYPKDATISASADAGSYSTDFITDVQPDEIHLVTIEVKCPESAEPWILDAQLSDGKVSFRTLANTTGATRMGTVNLSFTDAAETVLSATISVYQAAN